jgi:hypothetical protein
MSIDSCYTILMEDFGMHRVSAKFLPILLIDEGARGSVVG